MRQSVGINFCVWQPVEQCLPGGILRLEAAAAQRNVADNIRAILLNCQRRRVIRPHVWCAKQRSRQPDFPRGGTKGSNDQCNRQFGIGKRDFAKRRNAWAKIAVVVIASARHREPFQIERQ